ncbi:MAG: GlsB/YeaQ/YmgE family stress response membrane protein [Chloroflexota bacterium]
MSILAWLIVGLIAGWLAGMVMKSWGYGIIGDLIVGVLGALLGGFLAGVAFGGDYLTGINLITLIVAFLGAVILIAIVRALPGRSPV